MSCNIDAAAPHAETVMARVLDIAVLVGSLRSGSFTRRPALAFAAIAPDSMKLEIVRLGELALYTEDLQASPPASWKEFHGRLYEARPRRGKSTDFTASRMNAKRAAAIKTSRISSHGNECIR